MASTKNKVVPANKVPVQFTPESKGVIIVENNSSSVLEWSLTRTSEEWHTLNRNSVYQFGFSIFVRNLGTSDTTIPVTAY